MAIQDFIDFVETELPRRPVLLRGEEYTGNPNNSELGIVQGAPVGTFYLQYDDSNQAWQKIGDAEWVEVGSGAGTGELSQYDYKDIVFMLGVDLRTGRQQQTELWVPYKGEITDLYVSRGKDSSNESNIIFNLEKYTPNYTDDSDWEPVEENLNLQVNEYRRHFDALSSIDNDKLCIRLVSGDVQNLSNMSIMARLSMGDD